MMFLNVLDNILLSDKIDISLPLRVISFVEMNGDVNIMTAKK